MRYDRLATSTLVAMLVHCVCAIDICAVAVLLNRVKGLAGQQPLLEMAFAFWARRLMSVQMLAVLRKQRPNLRIRHAPHPTGQRRHFSIPDHEACFLSG